MIPYLKKKRHNFPKGAQLLCAQFAKNQALLANDIIIYAAFTSTAVNNVLHCIYYFTTLSSSFFGFLNFNRNGL